MRELAEDARTDGAVWVEVQFDTTLHGDTCATDEDLELFLDAVDEARAATGVGIGLVMAADRTLDPSVAVAQAHRAARYADRGVVAFGLVKEEMGHPPEPFAEAFAIARESGLISAPHAGERAGPASVRGALDALGATRIGHGVRAADDRDLLKRLADEGTCLDVCPTSNVSLSVYPSFDRHALAQLLEAGVAVTLNADNPLLTESGLLDEYELVRNTFGLSDDELATIARTSIIKSAMRPADKTTAMAAIGRWLADPA